MLDALAGLWIVVEVLARWTFRQASRMFPLALVAAVHALAQILLYPNWLFMFGPYPLLLEPAVAFLQVVVAGGVLALALSPLGVPRVWPVILVTEAVLTYSLLKIAPFHPIKLDPDWGPLCGQFGGMTIECADLRVSIVVAAFFATLALGIGGFAGQPEQSRER